MGIGTFTTLLLGYKTAERLFELERIEGREDAVERLDDGCSSIRSHIFQITSDGSYLTKYTPASIMKTGKGTARKRQTPFRLKLN